MGDGNKLGLVRLNLEVEGMRHHVVHALIDHHGDIEKAVSGEIERLISSGYLEERIKVSVQKHLSTAIDEAVKGALSSWVRGSPTVKGAIEAAITKALWATEGE